MSKNEYAQSGVDYTLMEPFKRAMIAVGRRTLTFPNQRGVFINQDVLHAHGAVYEYRGGQSHLFCQTQEDLGNKNWVAEWMYQYAGTGRTYYEGIGIDTALMVVNDVIAQGAMPVVFIRWRWEIAPGFWMRNGAGIWPRVFILSAKRLAWLCQLANRLRSNTLLSPKLRVCQDL